jgi:hypothetical protein
MIGEFVCSLSLWERAGVRVLASGGIFSLAVPSALTLTLSQRERGFSSNQK